MAEIVIGKEIGKKISAISLSNNTVQRSIADMSKDFKEQVVEEICSKTLGLSSILLDESTDVESCSQLVESGFCQICSFWKAKRRTSVLCSFKGYN